MTSQLLEGTRAIVAEPDAILGVSLVRALADHGGAPAELAIGQAAEQTPERVRQLVDERVKRLGGLDVLVVGHPAPDSVRAKPFEALEPGDWTQTLAAGPRLDFLLLSAALPHLRRSRNASVVFICGANAWTGTDAALDELARDASLVGLTRAAARELGSDGVRVNLVVREIGLAGAARGSDHAACLAEPADAGDVAGVVVALGSSLSRSVTGQTVMTNGGSIFV